MPKHHLELTVPPKVLLNNDANIEVFSDGQKLGILKVSKGSVEWRPANSKKYSYHMKWETFDSLMREKGTKR